MNTSNLSNLALDAQPQSSPKPIGRAAKKITLSECFVPQSESQNNIETQLQILEKVENDFVNMPESTCFQEL